MSPRYSPALGSGEVGSPDSSTSRPERDPQKQSDYSVQSHSVLPPPRQNTPDSPTPPDPRTTSSPTQVPGRGLDDSTLQSDTTETLPGTSEPGTDRGDPDSSWDPVPILPLCLGVRLRVLWRGESTVTPNNPYLLRVTTPLPAFLGVSEAWRVRGGVRPLVRESVDRS